MSEGQTVPIDSDLAARMDASLVAFWAAYARNPDSLIEEFPGALLIYTPIPLSLFNTVILTGSDPDVIETAFASAARCIEREGREVLWRATPGALTEEVRGHLERLGLQPQGNNPAMLADLSNMPPPPAVEGLEIVGAEGRSARYDWAWLTCDAFELTEDVREAMSACEAVIPESLLGDHPRYTGILDGKPVAVSSLVAAVDLAGIYAVATLPEARKRGIGTVMTLHAMAEGRRRGMETAVLQASDLGKPVYEKIGFSMAYDYALFLQE